MASPDEPRQDEGKEPGPESGRRAVQVPPAPAQQGQGNAEKARPGQPGRDQGTSGGSEGP